MAAPSRLRDRPSVARHPRCRCPFTGLGTVVEGIAYIQETHTITGGTGRFADATGTFVAGRVLIEATGFSTSSFDGTIDLHR